MTRPDAHTIFHVAGAVLVGLGIFWLVSFTSGLRTALAVELAWFWLSVGDVLICGRLLYLTWCRFWRRERAGYNGVARRLTLGYLRFYGFLLAASLTAAAVGFMTIITPNGGMAPETPFEVWAVGLARVVNIPLLLLMMVWLTTLIIWSVVEEERLKAYFERNDDKETR